MLFNLEISMKKFFIYLTLISLSITFYSCDWFTSSTPDDTSNNPTKEFTTEQGGSLKADNGSEIMVPGGAVTKNKDGESGKVIFTIDPNVKLEEYPAAIPSDFVLIGNVHHFGPSHFVFQYPIVIMMPATSLADLDGVYILWYNELQGKWVNIPISEIDAQNKRLGASVFELGYFAIVKDKNALVGVPPGAEIQDYHKSGGIRFKHISGGYYYTLLVQAYVPKYTEDKFTNMVGQSSSTGNEIGGNGPRTVTHMIGLRPGTYTIVVSRRKAGTFWELPGKEEFYSVAAVVNVNSFQYIGWDTENSSPWAELTLGGGQWQSGFPNIWPKATVSLGTGELQVTLSWTNTEQKIYTIDIFVYGPNNDGVSWHKPLSNDGCYALDRTSADYQVGYSLRNVYSVKKMVSGNYEVYVNIWKKSKGDGSMPIEVRVIRKGKFEKLIRTQISTLNYEEEKSKMLKVYSFNM